MTIGSVCTAPSDRLEGAGAPEIEITMEMIKAGIEAYRPYWADLADGFDVEEKMVRDVWAAMAAEERRSRES